ncbi:hypothetical protein ACFWU3_23440 [Streptomyces sp. NPDC058685]|uniref:hypothetical protein n=1 Tax=Streptomyces sp. NPDC058685 TaxID=3346598 RepID=UPI00366778A2
MSGHDVQLKALAALRTVKSVRVTSSFTNGRERTELKLNMDTAGRCVGSISSTFNGGMQMITTKNALYIKGDKTWYRKQVGKGRDRRMVDFGVALFADRWVKTTPDDPALAIQSSCDIAEMVDSFRDSPTAYKGEESTVDGKPCMVLFATGDGGDIATWHIATQGKPYLLKAVTVGNNPSEVHFSDFDKPVIIKVPVDAIDASQFSSPNRAA